MDSQAIAFVHREVVSVVESGKGYVSSRDIECPFYQPHNVGRCLRELEELGVLEKFNRGKQNKHVYRYVE